PRAHGLSRFTKLPGHRPRELDLRRRRRMAWLYLDRSDDVFRHRAAGAPRSPAAHRGRSHLAPRDIAGRHGSRTRRGAGRDAHVRNYPTSMLIDAVMFTSFLAHPYRNNTIGWESDIENLEHAAVVGFYERHYQPANAVLAVVGDFDS